MKVIIHLPLLLFLMLSITVVAQDDVKTDQSWKLGADLNSSFFQSSFVNWTEGGENTLTLGILGSAFAKYKKDKITWNNNLLVQYSFQKVSDNPFYKNIDKFEILSLAGLQATEKLDYSLLFSLKTQLTATQKENIVVSDLFAPAEILVGPGMKYAYGDKKTKSNFALNLSPATLKLIIVADDSIAARGVFTGTPDEKLKAHFGASLIGTYRVNLTDNITYTTNFELFSNYLEGSKIIDTKWFNMLSMKIWKLVTLTVSTDLRYDRNMLVKDTNNDGVLDASGIRFAQTFGVGLGYKFGN